MMCLSIGIHVPQGTGRSQGTARESQFYLFTFYVDPGDQTQVIKFGRQHIYLLNHLVSFYFSYEDASFCIETTF